MEALTKRQADLHEYLCKRWNDCPTVREMCAFMGVTLNAVQQHLQALERKGYIELTQDRRSRGIKLLIGPDLTGSEIEIGGREFVLVAKRCWETITKECEYARALTQKR